MLALCLSKSYNPFMIGMKNTLFAKISQLLILLVIVILLFSFFLFQTLKSTYDKMFYQKFRETIGIAVTYIENELDKISEITLYLSTDEALQEYLRMMNEGPIDYRRSLTRDSVKDILFKQAYIEPYLSAIELVLLQGETIGVGRDIGKIKSEFNVSQRMQALNYEGKDFFYTGDEGTLINIRDIRNTATLDFYSLGTMMVYMDINRMIEKFQRQIPYYSELNILVLKDNELLIGDELSAGIVSSLEGREEGFTIYREGDVSFFVTSLQGQREGWSFVGYTSMDELDRTNLTIWINIILSHLILAVIIISLGRLYVKQFTNPLEELSHKIKVFEFNDFSIALGKPETSHSTDEIIDLYRDVDLALKKIQDQIYEGYVKQMSLQKTQLQMLQSQINPHFLYNTLDSIKWMAKSKNENEIAQMVLSLGRLLRHSLSERRSTISLKEELDLLGDYLSIQKIRFQEKLLYERLIEVDPHEIQVLPFILQPLIENAIKYGIEEGEGRLTISLEIRAIKNMLEIQVCDNGQGFPLEILERYSQPGLIDLAKIQANSLGLSNVYSRLKLFYKGKADFITINPQRGGACIKITLPLEQSEES